MEFVKEFAMFLHQNGIIRFGEFTLASGKQSSYYIDLRQIPSFPHQFRKMVKFLQNKIMDDVGLESFDSLVSVPTGGLVIASALSIETVKPLIYVRSKPKDYGTSKLIEGRINEGMKVLMIDDVATSGGSMINAIKALKESKVKITDAYVIVNRLEGAKENLKNEGVNLHSVLDVLQIAEVLHDKKLIDVDILDRVRRQIKS